MKTHCANILAHGGTPNSLSDLALRQAAKFKAVFLWVLLH
jgi:hypothetical protein